MPTALCCSPWGRAAELATVADATSTQTGCGESVHVRAARAAPRAALLAAFEGKESVAG
jgi:hypothetical protein